jgi:hypothetical protein
MVVAIVYIPNGHFHPSLIFFTLGSLNGEESCELRPRLQIFAQGGSD